MKFYSLFTVYQIISTVVLTAQISDPTMEIKKEIELKGNVLSIEITKIDAKDVYGEMIKVGDSYELITVHFNKFNNPDSGYWRRIVSSKIIQSENIFFTYSKINNDERISKAIETKMNLGTRRLKIGEYNYDLRGNVILKNVLLNDILIEKEVSRFNEKSKLVEYRKYADSGKLVNEIQNKYGTNGKISEHVFSNSSGYYSHEKYKYNTNGNLGEMYSYNKNGTLLSKTNFKYNSLNLLTEEQYLPIENPEYASKKLIKYNTFGKIISEIEYYENGSKHVRNLFVYDDNGKLIEEENSYSKKIYVYNTLSQLVEKTTIYYSHNEENGEKEINRIAKVTYKYDSHGNWIEAITSNTENSSIFPDVYTVEKRAIRYRE